MDDQYYARTLRAIGQDLAELVPEQLELEQKGRDFVARGRSRSGTGDGEKEVMRSPLIKRVWKMVFRRGLAHDAEQSTVPFERRYRPDDIDRLDVSGIAHRRRLVATPDIHSPSEMLRTIGRIIDAEGGHLSKLTTESQSVTFEYRDAQGTMRKRILGSMELLENAAAILQRAREHEAPEVANQRVP